MTQVLNSINTLATIVTASADEAPKAPVSITCYDSTDEKSISFAVNDENVLDLCRLNDAPDELLISVSDDVGNYVAGVKIPVAFLQSYLSSLTQPHAA